MAAARAITDVAAGSTLAALAAVAEADRAYEEQAALAAAASRDEPPDSPPPAPRTRGRPKKMSKLARSLVDDEAEYSGNSTSSGNSDDSGDSQDSDGSGSETDATDATPRKRLARTASRVTSYT